MLSSYHCSIQSIVLALSLAATPWIQAQTWQPTKVVEYYVLAGAGGAVDQVARKMKDIMERDKIINQTILVSNRMGGGGTVAINRLLSQPGDGHHLATFITGMLNTRAIGEVPVSYVSVTPIVVFLEESIVVAVRADSPLKTGRDIVAKLKGSSNSLSIGIADQLGNHIHVAIAKPLKAAGVDVANLNVVPFRSSAESMVALLGGHIDVVSASTPNVVTQFQAGKIRLLAIATPERLGGALASVPTWKEQGVDATFTSVQGVLGPKEMTPEQIRYWERAFEHLSQSEEWKQFLASIYARPVYMNAADMSKYLQVNYDSTRALLQELNLVKK